MLAVKPVFLESKRGRHIISIGGYRFCRQTTNGAKTRWFCSTAHHKGCRAAIYTIDDIIVKINNEHNHNPVYSISKRGGHLISVGGYRFCRQRSSGLKTRWSCSTDNSKGCRAAIFTVDNTIVKINNIHNHNAVFSISKKGTHLIRVGGYSFGRQQSNGVKTRWRCSTGHKGCRAAIYTIDDTIMQYIFRNLTEAIVALQLEVIISVANNPMVLKLDGVAARTTLKDAKLPFLLSIIL
uniref:SFRICE_016431 n=1 Tax=Spodoptera frugiperda TaxID=7108 RepID=A0A2H1V0M4_SPOFR